ncbi:MAG: DsbA family protein [Deltaproteobacteria bacterium]|nr:DsbA family protein [Deltaproteobacteria bacterium]
MTLHISYVSDVLCIWAYVAEVRLDEVRKEFGASVELDYRFIPIFGATHNRIAEGRKDRGGYAGFGDHVRKVAEGFPHVSINERVWSDVAPTTSSSAHEMLCAVRTLVSEEVVDPARHDALGGRTIFEEATWQVRSAFFEHARDISDRDVLFDVLGQVGVPTDTIAAKLKSGEAMAEMCRDIELRDERKIEGSPTYYLNEGRQKLYGNVGYRVVSANLRELLEQPGHQASWC